MEIILFSIVIIAVFLLAKVFNLLAKNRELEEEKRNLHNTLENIVGGVMRGEITDGQTH
ncbi:MAG: hypothetical protein IKP00_07110 [Victivallales bacterium]|nr:hypothetical protein [Victivallales bacterium]